MLETGVPQLDRLLGGGLPEDDVLLLLGAAGAGKTTLAVQMGFHAASLGHHVSYVSTFSESTTKLLAHLEGFTFYDAGEVGERFHLRNLYPLAVGGDLGRLTDALGSAVAEHGSRLLLLDGLASIRDLHEDGRGLRRFIYELGATLAAAGCATLITSSYLGAAGEHLPEQTVADGVLELSQGAIGDRPVRTIRVLKLRGRRHLTGGHSARIDGDGFRIFPRAESMAGSRPDPGVGRERRPLGLEALDRMMDGGPPVGSTTTVAGAPGTGKTLLGLAFLAEGVGRGQSGLMVSFREGGRQLADRARRLGLDLDDPLRDGRLEVIHRPPVDLDPDGLVLEIVEGLGRTRADRVVVDTVGDLAALVEERRRPGFLTALSVILRDLGVTVLVTLEVAQLAGPELELSGAPIAVFAHNLLLMRNVEYGGELLRVLSVLKMRDSAHETAIRQYRIDDGGLSVLPPEATAEGLLEGISRLPSEARVKRRTGPGPR